MPGKFFACSKLWTILARYRPSFSRPSQTRNATTAATNNRTGRIGTSLKAPRTRSRNYAPGKSFAQECANIWQAIAATALAPHMATALLQGRRKTSNRTAPFDAARIRSSYRRMSQTKPCHHATGAGGLRSRIDSRLKWRDFGQIGSVAPGCRDVRLFEIARAVLGLGNVCWTSSSRHQNLQQFLPNCLFRDGVFPARLR